MFKGGLDVSFMIVYVGQNRTPEGFTAAGYDDAYKQASEKFDAIHRLTKEMAPNQIELALTSADVHRINKAGKKVAMIGVENGYPLGDEKTALARVKEFAERGARYMSLAHNGHSQLADSNTGEADGVWLHNGLSALGKQVVAELNRVGIMVDISHPVQTGEPSGDRPVEGAGDRLSFRRARTLQSQPQPRRRTAAGAQKERRGGAGGRTRGVCQDSRPPSAERTAAIEKLAAEFNVPASAVGRGGGGGTDTRTRRPEPAGRAERGEAHRAPREAGRPEREVSAAAARQRQGLRRSHRLHREEDRHRPCRDLVRL